MNKIDSSFISSSAFQPFEQITWDTLQRAYSEAVEQLAAAMVGNSFDGSKVYVLLGCIVTSSGGFTTIGAGALFAQGEIFAFVQQTIANPTGGHVIVANLQTVNLDTDSGSGTLFSDGSSHHVHLQRTVQFVSSGASGTGNLTGTTSANNDLANFIHLDYRVDKTTLFVLPYTVTFETPKSVLHSGTGASGGTVTLSNVNARPGVKVSIHISTALGGGFTAAVTATGSYILIGVSSLSIGPGIDNLWELTYLGNDGTNDMYLSVMT